MLIMYVGCCLTDAPPEFVEKVIQLKSELRRRGYHVLDFLGVTAGDSTDVWNVDIEENVCKAHMLVGVADLPSTGLGIEIGIAIGECKIPVLMTAHDEKKVTRLIQGVSRPNVWFSRYNNMIIDVSDQVDKIVNSLPNLKALHEPK
jgi:hypothetical protein